MKKITAFMIIFLFLFFARGETVDWFRSNSSAMTLEKIGEFRTDEFEWILKIEKEEDAEIRILFRNGEAESEWSRFFSEGELIRGDREQQ